MLGNQNKAKYYHHGSLYQEKINFESPSSANGEQLKQLDMYPAFESDDARSTAAGRRPKLSLASLIGNAILDSPGQKARLGNIYEWIAAHYPDYYRLGQGGWQNSIRHNLTINKAFAKLPKDSGDLPGKGCYWIIHPDHMNEFQDGVFTGKIRSTEYRNRIKAARAAKQNFSTPDLPSYSSGYVYDHTRASNMSEYPSKYLDNLYLHSQELSMSTPAFYTESTDQESCSTSLPPTSSFMNYQGPGIGYASDHLPRLNPGTLIIHPQQPMFASNYGVPPASVFCNYVLAHPEYVQPSQIPLEHNPSDPCCPCSLCVTLPQVSVSPNSGENAAIFEKVHPVSVDQTNYYQRQRFESHPSERE